MHLKISKKTLGTFFVLSLLSVTAFVGCTGDNGATEPENEISSSETHTTEASGESSALEILETVWSSYGEDEKFAVMGGDAAAGISDKPGSFSLEDSAAVDATLGFPENALGDVEEIASIVHMMNANNFTCGAFRLKDAGKAKETAAAMETHLASRQWMCGFPEKLVIAKVEESCIVSVFGSADIVDPFVNKLTDSYSTTEIIVDKPIE